MTATARSAFVPRELVVAAVLAALVQLCLFALFIWAGNSRTQLAEVHETPPEAIPIAVQPVLDELPLLKLGSKQAEKKALPDIWQKRAPIPVRRLEERSAASEDALDDPDEIPESELEDREHAAPTDEDEIVKEALDLTDEETPAEDAPEYSEEGAGDGVEEGTETDPLKARAVNLYQRKLSTWFNARFNRPEDKIPCQELRTLSTGVAVHVGQNRAITGFALRSSSGNAIFDAHVTTTMSGLVGQVLPPPPPLYPDILGSQITPRLSGAGAKCTTTPGTGVQDSGAAPGDVAPSPSTPDSTAPEDSTSPASP